MTARYGRVTDPQKAQMFTTLIEQAVAAVTVTASSGDAPPASHASQSTARYPKRKRAEIKYNYEDQEEELSEPEDYLPVKRQRTRPSKPLPQHKIFPFLSLPAELRNRIYEECLPTPTDVPENAGSEKGAIWLSHRQRFYRRTIVYIPALNDETLEEITLGDGRYARRSYRSQIGGRRVHSDDNDSDSEMEQLDEGPRQLGFNILSVCKTIYEEAAPMMYNRTLVFADAEAVFAFAASLSPRTAKLVRSIEIRQWGLTRSRRTRGYTAMAMLAAKGVTNLENLYLNCHMGLYSSYSYGRKKSTPMPKRVAKKVYRDCHLWLEAVGVAHGDMYKGVSALRVNPEHIEDAWSGEEEAIEMFQKELKRLIKEGLW